MPIIKADMETANSFKNAVAIAKEEMTIDLMARIINGEFSGAETRELIDALHRSMPVEENIII